MTWTERAVTRALHTHFAGRWVVLTQVTTRCAASRIDRRLDVLLWNAGERIGVEIKVTRADLAADVADRDKQWAWRRLTHRFAYAVPPDLEQAALDLVPDWCGVIVVADAGWPRARFARRCPRVPGHVPHDLPPRVVTALFARCSQAEAVTKGLAAAAAGDPAELAAELDRARRDLEIAHGQTAAARERADQWRRRFAALRPAPCVWCGAKVKPDQSRWMRGVGAWCHVEAAADETCAAARELETARQRAAGETYPHVVVEPAADVLSDA